MAIMKYCLYNLSWGGQLEFCSEDLAHIQEEKRRMEEALGESYEIRTEWTDKKPVINNAEISQGDNDVRVSAWITPNNTERKTYIIGMSIGNFNSGVWYDSPLVENSFDPTRQYPERFNIDMIKPADSSATDVWITIKEGMHGEFLAEYKLSGVISPPQSAAPTPLLPIPEQSKLYALELVVPSAVGNYVIDNRSSIQEKINFVANRMGWEVSAMELDSERINIYMTEEGSVTVGVVVTAILAVLLGVWAIVFGVVVFNWRLVEVERNETVQEGLESKDSALGILKGIREEYIKQGIDTSDIDAAILRIAETTPEAPAPGETPGGGLLGGMNMGVVALVAVAVLALRK